MLVPTLIWDRLGPSRVGWDPGEQVAQRLRGTCASEVFTGKDDMVRIRMRRVGARNQPSFRIVAADRESPRDGRFLEVLGSYNPRTEPSTIQIDEARLFHWMQHGAQPSDSVRQTLKGIGTWERWERFKAGEALETLVAEAEAATPEVDPRTRRDEFMGMPSKKKRSKAKQSAAEPAAQAPAQPATEAEAPQEAEAEQPEAEAEAPEAAEAAAEAEAPEAEAPAAEPAEAESEAGEGEETQAAEAESEAEEPEAEAESTEDQEEAE